MIVIDASAAVELAAWTPRAKALSALVSRRGAGGVHAPHLIDIEVANALRTLVLRKKLSTAAAGEALEDFAALRIQRYPHRALLPRIWELRDNLTPYDAAYVALAEALDAELLTTDGRIHDAPGHDARVTVV